MASTHNPRGRMRLWDESAYEAYHAFREHRHTLIIRRAEAADAEEKRRLQRRVTVTDRLLDELERTAVEMGWVHEPI